jgi:hypothetical protein
MGELHPKSLDFPYLRHAQPSWLHVGIYALAGLWPPSQVRELQIPHPAVIVSLTHKAFLTILFTTKSKFLFPLW